MFRSWRKIAEEHAPPELSWGRPPSRTRQRLAGYYGQDDELQLGFNFPFLASGFTAAALSKVVGETLGQLPAGAVPAWTMSNHDESRFTTRWCSGDDARAALALTILFTLPGTIVVYYGDEIGMTDVEVPLELQRDDMFLGGRGGHPSRTAPGPRCSGSRARQAVLPQQVRLHGFRSARSAHTTWPISKKTRDHFCPSAAGS